MDAVSYGLQEFLLFHFSILLLPLSGSTFWFLIPSFCEFLCAFICLVGQTSIICCNSQVLTAKK
jgi:hypothetical protein